MYLPLGCLLSLSCMLQLELPHINVISKCDIVDKEQIEMVLDSEGAGMIASRERTIASGIYLSMYLLSMFLSMFLSMYVSMYVCIYC
jgi:hypothetical protein